MTARPTLWPPAGTRLCRRDEIGDDECRGFAFGEGTERFEMFLVCKAGQVRAYVNDCPHAGTPLDWQENQFLNHEKTLLLCGTHGALFRIEDGRCVAGPCLGRKLTPMPIRIAAGEIRLD